MKYRVSNRKITPGMRRECAEDLICFWKNHNSEFEVEVIDGFAPICLSVKRIYEVERK